LRRSRARNRKKQRRGKQAHYGFSTGRCSSISSQREFGPKNLPSKADKGWMIRLLPWPVAAKGPSMSSACSVSRLIGQAENSRPDAR
jgi:hypothetical protein